MTPSLPRRAAETLLALGAPLMLACGSSSQSSTPTQPVAPVVPVATSLSIRIHPSGQRVGALLVTQPIVEVQDANGKLFTTGSLPVTAAIGTGGGTLAGQATINTTAGVATFTDLAVQGAPGERTLVFSSPALTSARSTAFTLNAGPPAALKLVTAPAASAQTLVSLTQQPVLQVADDLGNPVGAATTVTASITQGNATIVGGGTATANADGRVVFNSLALGALRGTVGPVQLRFTAAGLPTVDAAVTLDCSLATLTVGVAASDRIGDGDCGRTDGRLFKAFTLALAAPAALLIAQDASFTPEGWIQGPGDVDYWGYYTSTGTRVSYKVLVAAGETRLRASTYQPNVTGTFTLTAQTTSSDIGCDGAFIAGSLVASAQRLATTDCKYTDGYYYDDYDIGLVAGASVTATVTASFAPEVYIYDADENELSYGAGTSAASASYRNTKGRGFFYIEVTSVLANVTGTYNLTVTFTQPSGATRTLALPALRLRPSGGHGDKSRPKR